jgi:type III secretion protein U
MSQKTEQPTAKRLRDAREKGQVCKSQEVSTTCGLLAVFGVLLVGGEALLEALLKIFNAPLRHLHLPFWQAVAGSVEEIALQSLFIIALVLGVAIAAGLAGNLIQIGVLISPKAAMPSLNKLNPANWFKKTFALKNLVELCKTILKTLIICYVVKMTLEDHMGLLVSLPAGGLEGILPAMGILFSSLVFNVAPAFVLLAVADYFFQRGQYIKGLKMSKDEVKREYKEMEGDPLIKGKRKQMHQEMAMSGTVANARRASVVVTNPTHVAVALLYDEQKTPLPVIVGMGEGYLAQLIVQAAREEGIPVMRNVPLARALLADGVENEFIPADLIKPVAEVLRWVQSLK